MCDLYFTLSLKLWTHFIVQYRRTRSASILLCSKCGFSTFLLERRDGYCWKDKSILKTFHQIQPVVEWWEFEKQHIKASDWRLGGKLIPQEEKKTCFFKWIKIQATTRAEKTNPNLKTGRETDSSSVQNPTREFKPFGLSTVGSRRISVEFAF